MRRVSHRRSRPVLYDPYAEEIRDTLHELKEEILKALRNFFLVLTSLFTVRWCEKCQRYRLTKVSVSTLGEYMPYAPIITDACSDFLTRDPWYRRVFKVRSCWTYRHEISRKFVGWPKKKAT